MAPLSQVHWYCWACTSRTLSSKTLMLRLTIGLANERWIAAKKILVVLSVTGVTATPRKVNSAPITNFTSSSLWSVLAVLTACSIRVLAALRRRRSTESDNVIYVDELLRGHGGEPERRPLVCRYTSQVYGLCRTSRKRDQSSQLALCMKLT